MAWAGITGGFLGPRHLHLPAILLLTGERQACRGFNWGHGAPVGRCQGPSTEPAGGRGRGTAGPSCTVPPGSQLPSTHPLALWISGRSLRDKDSSACYESHPSVLSCAHLASPGQDAELPARPSSPATIFSFLPKSVKGFFFGLVHGTWKFPGQRWNLCHSSNPSCCSDNAGSAPPQENSPWRSCCGSAVSESN